MTTHRRLTTGERLRRTFAQALAIGAISVIVYLAAIGLITVLGWWPAAMMVRP